MKTKWHLLLLNLSLLGFTFLPESAIAETLPSFPGAEGFGAVTPGGRGGRVVKVINLNPNGPGSLQAACDMEGPRIVVFDGNEFGHIFDAQTGDELVQMCCHDSAWQITWSPTDERIFTVGGDGTGRVWDAETGVELIVYDVGGFPSGEYSPDGTKVLMATGFDGTTRVYPTWHSPQELVDYARECCIVRELTPEEREQFGLPGRD